MPRYDDSESSDTATDKLHDLKKKIDKAYTNGETNRRNAADDLVFYNVTHWDDTLLSSSTLAYRGQFDIIKKGVRDILADLTNNPIQVDFNPIESEDDDSADLAEGMYRTDDRDNQTQEAYKIAKKESVVCGVGHWELYTDYVDKSTGDPKQVIKRNPIHESNNLVFWDPDSKLSDHSDANYVGILTPYSIDGYKDLVTELTGEKDPKLISSNFSAPQYSYAFPWIAGSFEWIYVGHIYERKEIKDRLITFIDPFTGETVEYWNSELKDHMDELLDSGHEVVEDKEVTRYEVTKYVASGEQILGEYPIAGPNIPVVPMYGERDIVEGQEVYRGAVREAKDPQRLYNFLLSYMADIASRSPRIKPIYSPESIQGFQDMYEDSGADNNLPYLLMNQFDLNGNALPIQGPMGTTPEQTVPTAVTQLMSLSRDAIEQIVTSGLPDDIADTNLSGDAIQKLTAKFDQQSFLFQDSYKHAKRRDAEIWLGMAKTIYDTPRTVTMTMPDGTRKPVEIMKQVVDRDTGEIMRAHDLRNKTFHVYSDIGASYQSQRDKVRDQLSLQLQSMPPGSPLYELLTMKYLELVDGVDMKDVREYVRKQMIIKGYKEPETPEEQQMLAAIQNQPQPPDPNMVLAQAEQMKAQADMAREQREMVKDAADIEKDRADAAIDIYNSQTKRYEAEVKAAQQNVKLQLDTSKQIANNYQTLAQSLRLRSPQQATV